jgi:hypothetical protein
LKKLSAARVKSVFLNLPFEPAYEEIFVGLIVGLVTVGMVPRSVVELNENGDGRMERLFQLLKQCRCSVHDLSYRGEEFRYNMPFELGIAYALARNDKRAEMIVFEAEKRDLLKTLSDLRGFDPKIHEMNGEKALATIYASFASAELPDPDEVGRGIYKDIMGNLSKFRKGHPTIFNKRSFLLLVHTAKSWSDFLS